VGRLRFHRLGSRPRPHEVTGNASVSQ
jgi:hypothetical protein